MTISKQNTPALFEAQQRSDALLSKIKALQVDIPPRVAIVANGSLARREVTSQSDFDAYAVTDGGVDSQKVSQAFEILKAGSELKPASDGGAFGNQHLQSSFLEHIGGQIDDNAKFTRRMLFLLESVPLAGMEFYEDTVDKIIARYISDDITSHQLGRFLLNDVVRFYRTMCVDFEHKTVEQNKAWGVRNIKLVFSRKLMYFSGIVMCAQLAERTPFDKRRILKGLIGLTPVDRVVSVMGNDIAPALGYYDIFLKEIDKVEVRSELERVSIMRDTHTATFRFLKDTSHHFSWALVNGLRRYFPPSHPIHDALIV